MVGGPLLAAEKSAPAQHAPEKGSKAALRVGY